MPDTPQGREDSPRGGGPSLKEKSQSYYAAYPPLGPDSQDTYLQMAPMVKPGGSTVGRSFRE